ncbi:MAG: carboxypeptidase-like regulatory domain-containing protein [Planctomycetes bacterium]|nr:carboxypeptidase-like regulatory domain-containing protein [Planctomycetota bacterium]
MRALLVLLLVLLAAALVTVQWLGLLDGDPGPAPGASGAPTESPAAVGPANANATATAPANGAPSGTLVATRLQAKAPEPGPLADQPTAWLRVTDHARGTPVAGAAVRSVQRGGDLAFTDERGFAALPLQEREQLAVVADGYLLRLVPTRLGSTEAEPQAVTMVGDTWCKRRRLELPGHAGAEVVVRFRPLDAAARAASPMSSTEPVITRAWTEHEMLASRPCCADVPVQQSAYAADRVHRLRAGAEVRFTSLGRYAVEAATANGLVARTEFRLEANENATLPLRLELVPGVRAAGVVLDRGSAQPVAGARVSVSGGDPLGLLATTAADGAFAIGPLWPGALSLDVRSDDHEPLAFGPLMAPAGDHRIQLAPLPGTTLRGRVRARPSLRPLAGATVAWQPQGSGMRTAVTGADGTFALRATGAAAARLQVHAPGHVLYAELVEPNAPFADYDVWPAERTVRLELGLSAGFEGVVQDAQGSPQPGVPVRWLPADASPPLGAGALRRVLEGAVLELPGVATTGADGAFVLETNRFGPGRVVVDGAPQSAVAAEAIAGRTRNDLRLRR